MAKKTATKKKRSGVNRKAQQDQANPYLVYASIALLVLSVIIFAFNVAKINEITGRVTGTANLTIEELTSINFTTRVIDWGSGSVTPGESVATLDTAAGTVVNGNWTANSAGLILENNGNQNLTLDLVFQKTAAAFIGGVDGNALLNGDYRYNVSDGEVGSCLNNTQGVLGGEMASGYNKSYFYAVNTTAPGTRVCDMFQFSDTNDTLRIDLYLNISSTSNITGAAGDIITATATVI